MLSAKEKIEEEVSYDEKGQIKEKKVYPQGKI